MTGGTPAGRLDCVMPAAGDSKRMGRWKLTLPFDGETIVERCVRNALVFCSQVILVTGYRGEELSSLFSTWQRVTLVSNPHYPAGMFSSIRCGVRRVQGERFFVALADMPLVPPEIFSTLAGHPADSGAVRPFCRGRKGHPVLLPTSLIDKILRFDDAHAMPDVLREVPMARLSTDNEGVLADIDTPDDYQDLAGST